MVSRLHGGIWAAARVKSVNRETLAPSSSVPSSPRGQLAASDVTHRRPQQEHSARLPVHSQSLLNQNPQGDPKCRALLLEPFTPGLILPGLGPFAVQLAGDGQADSQDQKLIMWLKSYSLQSAGQPLLLQYRRPHGCPWTL